MEEREVGITELKASLDECLEEVRNGTTLVVTDGERHVARIRPESDASKETQAVLKASGIVWSGRRPLSSGNHAARTRVPGPGERMGLASCGTQLAPVRRTGRCVVRPVYALATATARVVPFACACDDVRHSCSSAGY